MSSNFEELCRACKSGDLRTVQGNTADPNKTCAKGETPLRTAIEMFITTRDNIYFEIIENLLSEKNANPNLLGSFYLASTGPRFLLKTLLEHHANPNEVFRPFGDTPLIIAVSEGRVENVQILLEYNADPNIPQNNGITCLNVAIRYQSPNIKDTTNNMVDTLLLCGAVPTTRDLYLAYAMRKDDVVDTLFQYGVRIDEINVAALPFFFKETKALEHDIPVQSDFLVQIRERHRQWQLLQQNRLAQNEARRQANIRQMVQSSSSSSASTALPAPPVPSSSAAPPRPPVPSSSAAPPRPPVPSHEEQIMQLGLTPLLQAIEKKKAYIAEQLIYEGADPNLDYSSITPLFMAVYQDMGLELIEILIRAGADPNIAITNETTIGEEGETPMSLATKRNRRDIVGLLLNWGANSSLSKSIAERMNNKEIIQMINTHQNNFGNQKEIELAQRLKQIAKNNETYEMRKRELNRKKEEVRIQEQSKQIQEQSNKDQARIQELEQQLYQLKAQERMEERWDRTIGQAKAQPNASQEPQVSTKTSDEIAAEIAEIFGEQVPYPDRTVNKYPAGPYINAVAKALRIEIGNNITEKGEACLEILRQYQRRMAEIAGSFGLLPGATLMNIFDSAKDWGFSKNPRSMKTDYGTDVAMKSETELGWALDNFELIYSLKHMI